MTKQHGLVFSFSLFVSFLSLFGLLLLRFTSRAYPCYHPCLSICAFPLLMSPYYYTRLWPLSPVVYNLYLLFALFPILTSLSIGL